MSCNSLYIATEHLVGSENTGHNNVREVKCIYNYFVCTASDKVVKVNLLGPLPYNLSSQILILAKQL